MQPKIDRPHSGTARTARLDRTDLLPYFDDAGRVCRGHNLGHWQSRRSSILRGMQEVMGPVPNPKSLLPLNMQVNDEVDCGTYLRRQITYCSDRDNSVPAYLLVPKAALGGGAKFPAVLALHPTERELGPKVIVTPSGKINRDYAHLLAERGMVVLAPTYPFMGSYAPHLAALGYQSGTMKAVYDNMRGLDLLDSLPYVDSSSYGTIGHSLGGHNTLFTAVFDCRIQRVVCSCGFDSFLDYQDGDINGWTQKLYMPRLADYSLEELPFDFYEVLAALAPRKVFISAPLGDANFKWESVERIGSAARAIYKLYGAEENLVIRHPDCGHDFPKDMRELSFDLLERTSPAPAQPVAE